MKLNVEKSRGYVLMLVDELPDHELVASNLDFLFPLTETNESTTRSVGPTVTAIVAPYDLFF